MWTQQELSEIVRLKSEVDLISDTLQKLIDKAEKPKRQPNHNLIVANVLKKMQRNRMRIRKPQ